MMYRVLFRRRSSLQRLVCGVTAVVFAILVSVAASHLHVGADQDEACALCAAFAGKLEGTSAPPLPAPTAVAVALRVPALPQPQISSPSVVALPPSCGPPPVA
jgi:hypothetical protein